MGLRDWDDLVRPGVQVITSNPKTPWGSDNRPDYGRGEVRQFIRDNAMTLLEELRADGLRLDSTVSIRRAKGKDDVDRGDIPAGWTLLRWLGEEKRRVCPWKLLIAEDLQNDPAIVHDALAGGMGLDAQWDARFGAVRSMFLAPDDAARRPSAVKEALERSYDPSGPFQRVAYIESHDQAHDQGRIPGIVAPGDSEGWLARKISALGAGLLLTAPAIPMLFMGQDFLEWKRWSDGRDEFMEWKRIGRWPGFTDLVRRLAHLRRNWENNTRGLRGDRTWVFHASDDDGVLAYLRQDAGGPGDDVVVVANLRDRTWPSYNVGFPRAGTWYVRFNSDWRGYCPDFGDVGYHTTAEPGWNQGPATGTSASGHTPSASTHSDRHAVKTGAPGRSSSMAFWHGIACASYRCSRGAGPSTTTPAWTRAQRRCRRCNRDAMRAELPPLARRCECRADAHGRPARPNSMSPPIPRMANGSPWRLRSAMFAPAMAKKRTRSNPSQRPGGSK